MANCVLCGRKMGLFDQVDIDFHGTRQSLCGDCYARWKNTHGREREELERQMLDSPDLMARERVRANVDTGKACPDCGAGIIPCSMCRECRTPCVYEEIRNAGGGKGRRRR